MIWDPLSELAHGAQASVIESGPVQEACVNVIVRVVAPEPMGSVKSSVVGAVSAVRGQFNHSLTVPVLHPIGRDLRPLSAVHASLLE